MIEIRQKGVHSFAAGSFDHIPSSHTGCSLTGIGHIHHMTVDHSFRWLRVVDDSSLDRIVAVGG